MTPEERRARAEYLREQIGSDVRRLRGQARKMVPRVSLSGSAGADGFRRLPGWAMAAAAGAVAGLVAGLRRRRRP